MEMRMVKELLLQALEHERRGVKIYETALKCALNEDLERQWERYRGESERHVQVLIDACRRLQLDPEEQTPGRRIAHDKGLALLASMEAALGAGDKQAAQRVACEAVMVAELIDHSNWELIGEVAKAMPGADGKVLRAAYAEVQEEEDEHFHHSRGWMRELALEELGLKAVLPPPEERRDVRSANGAARAQAERSRMRYG